MRDRTATEAALRAWADTPASEDESILALADIIRGDDAGDAPGSRYGVKASQWAPTAAAFHVTVARATGEGLDDLDSLDAAISAVVNDHDDVETILTDYGMADWL